MNTRNEMTAEQEVKAADDVHLVTEREWQEILHTLKDNTESIRMLNQMIRTLAGLKESR